VAAAPISKNKSPDAFRTIGELSAELGVAQHILRYWETRFPQLKPLQRAGGRRYYRPDDVALVRRIDALLARDGYTIRGVQRLLAAEAPAKRKPQAASLREVRDMLAKALQDDGG
jgi:DNA-binding transcriptional MerR regulator